MKAGWFYRSDQISFARVGVPAIWFKSGVDFIGREAGWGEKQYADWIRLKYHTPGDEFEAEWNFKGWSRTPDLLSAWPQPLPTPIEHTGWYPGDEFEAVRAQSLEALASEKP